MISISSLEVVFCKSNVCFSDVERLGRRVLCQMKGTTDFC